MNSLLHDERSAFLGPRPHGTHSLGPDQEPLAEDFLSGPDTWDNPAAMCGGGLRGGRISKPPACPAHVGVTPCRRPRTALSAGGSQAAPLPVMGGTDPRRAGRGS